MENLKLTELSGLSVGEIVGDKVFSIHKSKNIEIHYIGQDFINLPGKAMATMSA